MTLFALTSILSCKGIEFNKEDPFGQRLVTLGIEPEDYGLLNGQLLSKRPVAADIRVAGEFKVNCQVSYAGRSSLDSYRKSYDIEFCGKKYQKRSHYRLSAQAIDKTMLRAIMGFEIFQAMGIEAPKIEPATLYINKKYMGLYTFMEDVDKEFFKVHKIHVEEIYKARFANANFKQDWASRPQEAFSYDGKGEDNFTFITEIYKILWQESSDDAFASKISAVLDLDSYFSYSAVALYIDHWDGFDNNYFLAYDLDKKKLVTAPWDLDRIWEKPDELKPEDLLGRNELLVRLLKIPAFKSQFIAKLQKVASDFPVEKLVETLAKKREATHDAYKEDPILARYESTAFDEFRQKIEAWDLQIKAYLAANAG